MASNVVGVGEPSDYSLYMDVTFGDGSHRWAFTMPFSQDRAWDGKWQQSFGVLDFAKPIHHVSLVLMFRWRTGTVLFDNVAITDVADGICGIDVP